MSIKTLGEEVKSNSVGLEKEINAGAKRLIFDVLQATQYSTPIASTIRELVTNACDSQREKEIAVEILTGAKKVEDYYITRNGEEYEDSNFDSSYYDLNHLNLESNNIEIHYITNDEGVGYCDTVKIIDYGVGIGGKRLEGISQLGFSTKRNTAENFGAFGLGSKVALSTGVPYYTIETVYNGKRFVMNCFPYKTDFIGTDLLSDGYVTLSNGVKAYYKNTDSKNYTTIKFGVKKHNRSAFKDSVRQQLNYLFNVKFWVDDVQMFTADEPLLNTNHLIVGESRYFARPHIVIVKHPGDTTGINYGKIDFNELEMEDLSGNIGIKCPVRQSYIDDDGNEVLIQDGVEVTPSREKVIWNEHTKKYLLEMIEKASEDCSNIIQEALVEDDLVNWLKLCSVMLYKGNNSSIEHQYKDAIYEIAKMINPNKIRPKFKGIKFESPYLMFENLHIRQVKLRHARNSSIIERVPVSSWADVDFDQLYVGGEVANHYIDRYLVNQHRVFYLITPTSTDEFYDSSNLNLFLGSEYIKFYDTIEVPKIFKDSVDKAPKEDSEKVDLNALRKLNGEVIGHSLRVHKRAAYYTWDKMTLKIANVINSEKVTYYGSMDEDGWKIKLAANFLWNKLHSYSWVNSDYYNYSNSKIFFHEAYPEMFPNGDYYRDETKIKDLSTPQLIAFSQGNMKYAKSNPNWKHIDEFFFEHVDDTLVPSSHIKAYLTARELNLETKYQWVRYNKTLFETPYNLYVYLEEFVAKNEYKHHNLEGEDAEKARDLMNYIHKFKEYHEICKTDDLEAINLKSFELFIVSLGKINVIYDEVLEAYEVLKEFNSGEFGIFMHRTHMSMPNESIKHHTSIWELIVAHYDKQLVEFPDLSKLPIL